MAPTAKETKWTVQIEPEDTSVSPVSGPAYRCSYAKDGFPTLPGVETTWDIFSASFEKYKDNDMLGSRSIVNGVAQAFKWKTYKEVGEKVAAIGAALTHIGMSKGDRVGIYGVNSTEWVIALGACYRQSFACVPLYDSLGANAVQYIVNHATVSTAIVQQAKLPQFFSALPQCKDTLKTVVSMGGMDEALKEKAADLGVQAYSFEEFLQLGVANPADPTPPTAEDICTIMYTSGTTGEPKGVIIKHRALLSVIASTELMLKKVNFSIGESDVFLSYLPLAHIFDLTFETHMVLVGAKIGFWQGDVKLLINDIGELRPTLFPGVPRIFDRIYAGVTSKMKEAGVIKQAMFNWAYKWKLERVEAGIPSERATPVWNMLIFNKIKQRLGGRVRLIISGAAPLARHVEDFLRVAMCVPVLQGYGLTESCAASFLSIPYETMAGTVGPPMPNLDIKLEAVPEMNYDPLADPPRGEVCMKGPALFSGYYKREDLTNEVLVDNWFHTGDVGEWQPDGTLKIIDRKKNIFKLSQGEYVAVENLENVYGQCSDVDMVWVYGNSFENVLVAVAVPNQPALEAWAKSAGIEGDYEALCKLSAAQEWVIRQLSDVGRKAKLKGFEIIKAIHLDHRPFDIEKDLLTPTFKKKRPQLLKFYKAEIDAMYADVKKKEASKPVV